MIEVKQLADNGFGPRYVAWLCEEDGSLAKRDGDYVFGVGSSEHKAREQIFLKVDYPMWYCGHRSGEGHDALRRDGWVVCAKCNPDLPINPPAERKTVNHQQMLCAIREWDPAYWDRIAAKQGLAA